MDIREAIEKAGPGGKVRRGCWDEGKELIVPYSTNYGFEPNKFTFEQGCRGICNMQNLTATDWQVVEETIEVGYEVNKSWCEVSAPEHVCVVLAKKGGVCALQHKIESTCVCNARIDDLRFIRKGEKHVFEGVEFVRKSCLCIVPQRTDEQPMYPWASFEGNGKTYRATFEPMED
jgi:hypothetical protein